MNKLLVILVVASGCGTLFNKKEVTVKLADGYSIDGATGTTTIALQEDHVVVGPDGQCTLDSGISVGYFILDLFAGGPIPWIIDAITGKWRVLKGDCDGISEVED